MIPWGGGGPSLPPAFHTPTSLVPTILSPRELALRGGLHQKTSRGAGQGTVWQVLNSEGDGSRNSGTWKEHDTFTMILFIMSLCLLRTEKVTPLQVPQQVGWLTGVRERQALMGVQRQSKFPQGQLGLSFGCLPPTPPLSWHRACPLAWDLPEHIEQPVPEKRGKLFGLKLTPPRTLLPALLRVLGRGALLFLGRGL